jgi:hypothetical protein
MFKLLKFDNFIKFLNEKQFNLKRSNNIKYLSFIHIRCYSTKNNKFNPMILIEDENQYNLHLNYNNKLFISKSGENL